MEELKLSQYLDLCLKFKNEPTEENEKLIKEFLNKVELREYIPIKSKILNVGYAISEIPDDYEAVSASGYKELTSFIFGLLPYAFNVINDMPMITNSYGAYDLFREHGLYNLIYDKCNSDYQNFLNLYNDSLNFHNISKIVQTASFFNNEEFDKWEKLLKEWKEELTPEVLEDMKALIHDSDENKDISELAKEIRKSSIEEANRQYQEELAQLRHLMEEREKNN